MAAPLSFVWVWDLELGRDALWAFVSDTQRFNGLLGLDPIEIGKSDAKSPGLRKLTQKQLGRVVHYTEEAFEWDRPYDFSVRRFFEEGGMKELTTRVRVESLSPERSRLHYAFEFQPSSFAWSLIYKVAFPAFKGKVDRLLASFVHRQQSLGNSVSPPPVAPVTWAEGGQQRLSEALDQLVGFGQDASLGRLFGAWISQADGFDLARIQPYRLAEQWKLPRRQVLEFMLEATRVGMVSLQWEILCPSCRGSSQRFTSLAQLKEHGDCDSCQVAYAVSFDRLVEATFVVHPSIRPSIDGSFCTGGPQKTPHVVFQKWFEAEEKREVSVRETGHYRVRFLGKNGFEEVEVPVGGRITVENLHGERALALVERTVWLEIAASARDLLGLQRFRDLYATDAVAKGALFPMGQETIVFTDLKGSTKLYLRAGDVTAFQKVLTHFEILKKHVNAEEGVIVKTIGDAIMAVFDRPIQAVRAMASAQAALAELGDENLVLKAGIHAGSCLSVNLNDRMDYFGTTVNLASRLESFSKGDDMILSPEVVADAEVRAWLDSTASAWAREDLDAKLKGFDEGSFKLLRVVRPT
jgi:class 3 adenylate cyclase